MVATGGVRGFALMLLLGTLISMFTAVLATRALLGVLSRFRWFDNPRFMGASAEKIPEWQKIDIVGLRRIWFTTATVLLVVAVAAIIFKGLNLGIDFEGHPGLVRDGRADPVEDVRDEIASRPADAVIQGAATRRTAVPAVPDQDRVADDGRPERAHSPRERPRAESSASATSPGASASRS
jgi:SecD/SecF fusion protein